MSKERTYVPKERSCSKKDVPMNGSAQRMDSFKEQTVSRNGCVQGTDVSNERMFSRN